MIYVKFMLVIAFIHVVASKEAVCFVKLLSTLCSLSADSETQIGLEILSDLSHKTLER